MRPLPLINNKKHLILLGTILVVGAALLIFFSSFDHNDLQKQTEVFLSKARNSPWAMPLVIAFYVIGGMVMFPVTVTNLAIAIVFGLWGILYALIGAMVAAILYFGGGRLLGRHDISKKIMALPRVHKIDSALEKSGVLGITILRYVPICPYALFNLISGMSSIRFWDYTIATFMALLPGAVARGILGDSLTKVFLNPTPETWTYLGCGIALWIAMLLGMHFLLKKLRSRSQASASMARR